MFFIENAFFMTTEFPIQSFGMRRIINTKMQLLWLIVMFGTVAGGSDKVLESEPRTTGLLSSLTTRFMETDALPLAPDNLDFIFIIIRRGMVAPESTTSKTYPSNWFYKSKWSPGHLTTDAKRLMQKLGRSLYTRYKNLIGDWHDERIFASSSERLPTQACAQEVVRSLFESVTPPRSPPYAQMDATIDKDSVFFDEDSCLEYWKLRKEGIKTWTNIDSERDTLYKKLRKKTGVTEEEVASEWYINSPEKVYWLWEILDFERKSSTWKPIWYDETMRKKMYEVVKDYYKTVMESYWNMPIYFIGPMFQAMLDGFFKRNRQVHIHVTDDATFAAFKSMLLYTDPVPPEVGEALLVEVDMFLNTRVHSYRPYHSIFNENLLFDNLKATKNFNDLDERINNRLCLPMSQGLWRQRCHKSEFLINLPPSFSFHEGCDPTWHENRRVLAEENRRRLELESRRAVIKRSYSDGESGSKPFSAPSYPTTSFSGPSYPATPFSAPIYPDTDDQTSHSDISRDPERAYSFDLPGASAPLFSQSPGRFGTPLSPSRDRMDYADGQVNARGTPLRSDSF